MHFGTTNYNLQQRCLTVIFSQQQCLTGEKQVFGKIVVFESSHLSAAWCLLLHHNTKNLSEFSKFWVSFQILSEF